MDFLFWHAQNCAQVQVQIEIYELFYRAKVVKFLKFY